MQKKENEKGILYKEKIGDIFLMNIFTKSKNFRGGYKYFHDKKFILQKGKGIFIWSSNGKNFKKNLEENKILKINKNVPHFFYFTEDSVFTEWWDGNDEKEKFLEYKKENLKIEDLIF